MQEGQYGTSEIKKVVGLGIELFNVAPEVMDAKGATSRLLALSPLKDELIEIVTFDQDLLKKQWDDLSDAEMDDVYQFAKDKYDIADDQVEEMVEEGFDIALEWIDLLSRTYDYGVKAKTMMRAAS